MRVQPAAVVMLAGVSAALHVGKLAPALPVLRDSLGLTLVQSGFMLSLVQLAGMALGLAVGLLADGIGLRLSMVSGLLILGVAGILGGSAADVTMLLVLRAVEGFGFLLASMPAPSVIRRLVPPERMNSALGMWGAYMPFGTALALLVGPLVISALGWQMWWQLLALISIGFAAWLWHVVPSDPLVSDLPGMSRQQVSSWRERLNRTLRSPGPWLVAVAFAVYSGQWLAVIGFLPSIYAQASIGAGTGGVLSAGAAAVNMVGNIAAGRLLQHGVPARTLMLTGYAAMALGAFLAFGAGAGPAVQYGGVLLFSMVGGMIPGTLFSAAVKIAPTEQTVSTTVGWMQQWSAFGQFAGPPLVALVAGRVGNWSLTWMVTGIFALVGAGIAMRLGPLLHQGPAYSIRH